MKPVLSGFFFLILFTTILAAAQQTPAGAPAQTTPPQTPAGGPRSTSSPQQAPAATPTQAVPDRLTPVIPMQVAPGEPSPQQPTVVNPPQAGPQQSPTSPDYSQEAAVIEHYHQAMRFENDGTGRDQLDAQIKVVSESGVQALGQLKVGYSALSDELEIVYVRVRKPDGTVVTAQESAIQDLTLPDAPVYTDYHEKHISVPALRPGDTLEYQFVRTTTTPLAPGQFWTSVNFAGKGIILDQQLEINVPKGRQINLKSKPGYEPKVTEEGDRRIYRWIYSHLKDEEENAHAGKKKNLRKAQDEIPTVQLTTFQSWEELGAWYASLEKDRRQPNDAIKAKAEELVQGKTDDLAKVKALYEYVSRNIRYVSLSFGLGRYQPHEASEVLANSYGDCKDKNTLLAALLAAQGFQATSVLIGSQHELDPEIPSPLQFDHVITRVPVDGKEIWMDSTNGVAPFRMLAVPLRDKQALAIPPDGKAGLVWTPADLPFEAFDRSQIEGSINETGTLKAHVTVRLRGDSELVFRFTLRQIPGNHWKDFFTGALQRMGMKGVEIDNLTVSDPSNPDDPLQIDLDATANNYFDWSAPESKMSLPFMQIALPSEGDANDDNKERPKPIRLGALGESSVEVRVSVPPKYTVHLPIGVEVKRDYAQYASGYKFDAGQLTAMRTLKLLSRELPVTRREDYAAFRRAIAADEAQEIALDNKSPGTAGVGANESAEDLNESAKQALKNNNYQLAISLFQQVVKLEPQHKTAWDEMGRAYLALNQNDQAIAVFKKQIEIDAYHEYAYNDLGVAYQRELKYDEAIQQFRKQIDINPLDPLAHASLGQVYVAQKKFAEAVPELEKAVTLQPNNPVLLISLGQSYIATNQTDKGMAQFEKATSVSPSPLTWNNIAYSLAEQGVQLDRADKYADAAINAMQTQLRDVKLDSLRYQDLAAALFLYDIWDTKGWIAFKRGDLDMAEQYLTAAWQASGSGTMAEHLAEIYEKQGKREQAIRTYVDALAGDPPSDTARGRLAVLGVSKGVDQKTAEARHEMQRERSTALQISGKGSAQFYLLVSPAKVEQAKFIKGSEGLKGLAGILEKTDVEMKFPAAAEVRVVRRGVVTCGKPPVTTPAGASGKGADPAVANQDTQGQAEPCTLELLPAEAVRTLD
jgi:tetratricopeptide (TPR) repeat protein/transglutaminase-like putative cysteine protease